MSIYKLVNDATVEEANNCMVEIDGKLASVEVVSFEDSSAIAEGISEEDYNKDPIVRLTMRDGDSYGTGYAPWSDAKRGDRSILADMEWGD